MKQTAMQELIERLESLSKKYHNGGLLTAIEIANSLLEVEKQQIIDAYWNAYKENQYSGDKVAEEYYQETYVKSNI